MPDIWNAITGSLALLGAVLGVMNSWKAFVSDRLKLRLRAICSVTVNAPHLPNDLVGIEVINLSQFPVTIVEIGFTVKGSPRRCAFVMPFTTDNQSLPRRLESREAIVGYADARALDPKLPYAEVYARTACGKTVKFRQKDIGEVISQVHR